MKRAEYKGRALDRDRHAPISLLFITFPYLFEDLADLNISLFDNLRAYHRVGSGCRTRNRTGYETGVTRCLTSTLYSSTGCEIHFLPELSKCLNSSHFPDPPVSIFSKTEASETKHSPKIQGVSFLRKTRMGRGKQFLGTILKCVTTVGPTISSRKRGYFQSVIHKTRIGWGDALGVRGIIDFY